MKQLRDASIEALTQIISIIKDINQSQYVCVTQYSSSHMGNHVRHVVDHYLALRSGLLTRTVNYNMRHRNSQMETDPKLAFSTLEKICHWLQETDIEDDRITIETEISVSTTCNKTLTSTVSRELCYLINHTIHHAAYISVIARQLGLEVSKDVGIAPATNTYLRAVKV